MILSFFIASVISGQLGLGSPGSLKSAGNALKMDALERKCALIPIC